MNFGKYDRLCTIQRPREERGEAGGTSTKWDTDFQFWAVKAEQGSREFRAAGVVNEEITAIFSTHFNPAIKAAQRLECDGVVYQIEGTPREGGRRDETIFEAKSLPTP